MPTRRKLTAGAYNVRLEVNRRGEISVGWMHKLYKAGKGFEWKQAPKSMREGLARSLFFKAR